MFPAKHSKYPVVVSKDIHPNVTLYHDMSYGLRKAQSQRRRAFRLPIVYSNSLADLCVPSLGLALPDLTFLTVTIGITCLWNA